MTLFDPLRVGALQLPNRIVMAPLGRARADAASREEATHVSPSSVSRPGTSAIHSEGQVAAWRRVTDRVHDGRGRIFQQVFHLGRKADPGRLRLNAAWNPPEPSTFYSGGDKGYIDYPFLAQPDVRAVPA
jgi:N-ethylmaleimide reductase